MGSGPGAQWTPDSFFEVAIDKNDRIVLPMQALVEALHKLRALATLPTHYEMRVVIADCWLAILGLPWSSGMKHTTSALSFACRQLEAAGFEVSLADTLKLDDAPFGMPRLVVAYPALVLTALEQWVDNITVRLTSILPLSVAAWALAQHIPNAYPQALAVLDKGLIIIARSLKGTRFRLSEITLRNIDQNSEVIEQAVCDIWQRLSLRESQLAEIKNIALFDLSMSNQTKRSFSSVFMPCKLPSAGGALNVSPALSLVANVYFLRHPLDALSSQKSPLTLSRAIVLAAAIACVGIITVQAVKTSFAVRSLTSQLNTTTNTKAVVVHHKALSREEIAQAQAVNIAIRELNLPVSEIVRALEPPKSIRVAVLSIETGSSHASIPAPVKIVALARTGAEMMRYIAFVAKHKPFNRAYLTRHEIDDTLVDRPYRFTMEASWRE